MDRNKIRGSAHEVAESDTEDTHTITNEYARRPRTKPLWRFSEKLNKRQKNPGTKHEQLGGEWGMWGQEVKRN